jgi:anti-repressor protein
VAGGSFNELESAIMTHTDLIPVFTGTIQHQSVQLCNARDLHKFLESQRQFANWIKERIEQYGFTEREDFLTILLKTSKGTKGGRPTTEYHLTLDMAKELAMVENNEKGRQIRRYFISLERSNKPALPDQTASQDHLMRCVELASHLATVAQKALINTLLKSGDMSNVLVRERFMVCFDHEMRPYAKAIDPDAMIVTLEQLASFISQPNGIMASDTELMNLAKACMTRLSERIEYQVKKASNVR